jgi:hypothetical protein
MDRRTVRAAGMIRISAIIPVGSVESCDRSGGASDEHPDEHPIGVMRTSHAATLRDQQSGSIEHGWAHHHREPLSGWTEVIYLATVLSNTGCKTR